jgi:hypothetical protein
MGFDDGNIIYLKIFRNDFLKFIFNINAWKQSKNI